MGKQTESAKIQNKTNIYPKKKRKILSRKRWVNKRTPS